MANYQKTPGYQAIRAAAVRAGLPVNYLITVNGKEIETRGFVQSAVKTGDTEITITIKHYKTGELHTNTLHAGQRVLVHMSALVNAQAQGSLTLIPGAQDYQALRTVSEQRIASFREAVVGAAL
jgi:hypothetical protein